MQTYLLNNIINYQLNRRVIKGNSLMKLSNQNDVFTKYLVDRLLYGLDCPFIFLILILSNTSVFDLSIDSLGLFG